MVIKKILLSASLICTFLGVKAQRHADTLWSASLNQDIHAMEVAVNGILVVSGSENTFGIDPATGKTVWTNQLAGKLDHYAGTPFITVSDHVINPANGQNVNIGNFAATTSGEPIHSVSQYFFYDSNLVLVHGRIHNSRGDRRRARSAADVLSLTELSTGKNLWTRNDYFSTGRKSGNRQQGSSAFILPEDEDNDGSDSRNHQIIKDPLITASNSIILPMDDRLVAVDISSGDILWQADYPAPFDNGFRQGGYTAGVEIALSINNKTLFVANDGTFTALDIETGKNIWNQPVPAFSSVIHLVPADSGLLVLPAGKNAQAAQKDRAAMYDLTTGKKVWETPISGFVQQSSLSSAGMVLVMENHWGHENINVLSLRTGKMVFQSKYKISGKILYTELLPSGLLYVTTREANVLDLRTGDAVNQYSITKKEKEFYLNLNQPDAFYLLVTGDNDIMKIDKNTGIISTFSKQRISFHNDEQPEFLEAFDGSIIAYSSQNIVSFDTTGSVQFKKYYPAPGISNGWKVATVMGAVALTTAAVLLSNSRVHADIFIGPGMVESVAQRFKKSRDQKEDLYMLSNNDDGELSILKIRKSDGMPALSVPLIKKDRDPVYTIDDVSNILYYAPNYTGEAFRSSGRQENAKGNILAYKMQ